MKISPQATTAAGECELYRFTPHSDPDEARKWFIERAERLVQFAINEASKELVFAINRVLDDEESRPGGWGPDITCVAILKQALADFRANSS